MFSCRKKFTLFQLHWWALRWRDIQISIEVFPPTIYNSWTHYVQLAFFLPANKLPTSYEDVLRHTVSEAAELAVNVFSTIVYADFETAIHNAMTTMWPGLEVEACSFHLGQSWWGKIQSLGLSKQYGKWGKPVLEENVRTVAFITGGSLRLLCIGIFIQSSERQASGTVLQLPARKLYWCRLHFSSACLVRMHCIIIEDNKRMWVIPCPLQCTILQCAS